MTVPAAVLKVQHDASDPASSAWVAANAGSGKTHVLAQRVIRLLLRGTPPEKILCLTYTKAAAALVKVMQRIFIGSVPASSSRITRCASTCVLPEPAFAATHADTAGSEASR